MPNNSILITGSAGFIGFHVAQRLLSDGREVVGVDSVNDYYNPKLKEARLELLKRNSKFTFVKLDLADRAASKSLFKHHRFPAVVHLAAQAGVRYSLQDNVDHPISLYAASKKANELMAHAYSHLYRIPASGLRFFTVYGPWGRPDMAMFIFAKAILGGTPIKLFNHGNMRRDFTYVDDVTEAIVRLMHRPPQPDPEWSGDRPDPGSSAAPWKIYNIGNNNPEDLMHVVSLLEKEFGRPAAKEMLPMQPGDVPATYADVEDLAREIGFRPGTTIEDGVARFAKWYREYNKI